MIWKWNESLSWFLRFWSTNLSLFTNSQKFEIFIIFVTISKIYELPRLKLPHSKAFTKIHGISNHKMALGIRVLGLEDKVGIHCFFYSDFMYLDCANLQTVKEMSPLFVSFDILQKKGKNIEENLLIEQICHWGAILYASPCRTKKIYFGEKNSIVKFWHKKGDSWKRGCATTTIFSPFYH